MRGLFEDGLRCAFPPCYDPPPPEMKQLLHRLYEKYEEEIPALRGLTG
jgi:hypothetical protein